MPLTDRPWVAAFAVGYLLLMLAIGLASMRRSRSPRGFFIAEQKIGLLVAGLGTMSAAFSGFVFLGGPGLCYRLGVSSLWINVSIGFTATLLCHALAFKLRTLAGVREVFTIPDAFAERFPGSSAAAAAALAVLAGSVAYLAAQLLALGVLLQAVLGLEQLESGMLLGALVLVAYSAAGGMVAGAYSDLVQGLLMLLGAFAVYVSAVTTAGGWPSIASTIAGSPLFGGEYLSPLGRLDAFTAFGFFFVFGVGVLGQPQMLHKFYMLDDPRKLRWFPAMLGGSQAICLLVWGGVGLAVPALVASGRMAPLARPDDAMPRFLLEIAPEPLAGLVLSAALAAIMSTSDSFLNIGAAALVRDLPRALGRPLVREVPAARLATIGVGAGALLLAWQWGGLIALLGTLAFGTFAAALAPALVLGMHWTRVGGRIATASIVTGLVLNLGLEFLARQTAFELLPRPPWSGGVTSSMVAVAASFVVVWLGGRFGVDEIEDATIRRIVES